MQLRARRQWPLFVLPLIVLFAPVAAPAGDKSSEPDGFGKAKFGMNESKVKALYPKAQEVVMPTPPPGEPPPFILTMSTLENQSVGPLTKCKVTLRFFEHELTDVQYLCAQKEEQVYNYLQKRFGAPTQVTAQRAATWVGQTSSVSEVRGTGVFMFSDLARSRKLSMKLLAYAVKKGVPIFGGSQTPGAPAATPEAAK